MKKIALMACVAAVAINAAARSITDASFTQAGATTTVSVTFEFVGSVMSAVTFGSFGGVLSMFMTM